jgi:hypothetical protein
MLGEGISIQPNFLALSGMAVLEDFSLVAGRDLIPLSDVFEIASLIRLGAFLVVEGKERAQLLLEVVGEQLRDWCSLLTAE